MIEEARLQDLLSLWQERLRLGENPATVELCRDCPELAVALEQRIQALRQMDRLVGQVNETIDAPSASPQETLSTAGPAVATLPQLPGYEILSELGRGGMGIVYKARDRALKHTVAIKMLLGAGPVPENVLARFRGEGESLARLVHPHIIRVLTSGEHQGAPYFVMEYVEGGGLDRKLTEQPPPPRDAARLLLLLARAVHAAHQRGIVHRDLKPANVLMAPPADEPALNCVYGSPRVSDFGLARHLDELSQLTQTGAVMGTPAYMAPEQAFGQSQEIGPATDLYALGVILYELLTGRVPFKAATALQLLEQVRSQPPERPSKRFPETPPALEAICLRCLAKAPRDRYPTAAALAADLARFLDGQPVQARAPVRTGRWRLGLALAALGVVVLIGVAAWALWPSAEGGLATPQPGGDEKVAVRAPFKGYVDVQVNEPGKRQRQGLWLGDAGALPFRENDEICVVARLDRPAYLYVLWIDTAGKVLPVYPWRQGRWEDRPAEERALRELRCPEALDEFYPMEKGLPGMETLVLLARETPLPREVDLRSELSGLPPQDEKDVRAAVWFEDGHVVRDEPQRAPRLDTRRKGHAVFQVQERVRQVQQRHGFSYSRAVSFANLGQ